MPGSGAWPFKWPGPAFRPSLPTGMDMDKTMSFTVEKDKNVRAREILKTVYQALLEKGYNPINQIVGYILSGDPTYITSHKDARNLIRLLERDELLEKMVKNYIGLDE